MLHLLSFSVSCVIIFGVCMWWTVLIMTGLNGMLGEVCTYQGVSADLRGYLCGLCRLHVTFSGFQEWNLSFLAGMAGALG